MEIKCGNDLVLDARFEKHLADPAFLQKIFHPSELTVLETKKLSGIFALKESVIKAYNLPAANWLEIEIKYQKSGKPQIHLSAQIRPDNLISIDGSVSHENDMTIALVVCLMN